MNNEPNSGPEADSEQRPQLEWDFINWDTVTDGFAHNVFFSSQFDRSGRPWGFTLTFTTSPPPMGEIDEKRMNVVRAVVQHRVTIPYDSFKSMVDFVLTNYESVFGEELPAIERPDNENTHDNEG